jgi:hypothetical protein
MPESVEIPAFSRTNSTYINLQFAKHAGMMAQLLQPRYSRTQKVSTGFIMTIVLPRAWPGYSENVLFVQSRGRLVMNLAAHE